MRAVSSTSEAPRIPPLPAEQQDEQARELLNGVSVAGAPAANIFSTLVRHPGLFRRWLPFGGKLLGGGKLPARDRELLILRTGWLCHAEYEWGQHRVIAKSIGIADDEIERVREGPDADGWDLFDGDAAPRGRRAPRRRPDLRSHLGRAWPRATTSSS